MTKWQEAQKADMRRAKNAIGAGDLFFSPDQVITHWDQFPELDIDPFDDDLSNANGTR